MSSAASPVGGDRVRLDVVVDEGARLTVRTVAATIVYPSATGSASTFDLAVEVGVDATLEWCPEPVIVVDGCRHTATARVRLGGGASLRWHDIVRLGRWLEPGGSLLQRTVVDRDGKALLRHDVTVGPAWPGSDSPATLGRFPVVGSAVRVGLPATSSSARRGDDLEWATHPLADDAAAWTVLGRRADEVRAVLERALGGDPSLGMPRQRARP